MTDAPQREMSLEEYVGQLPASHLARRQYDELRAIDIFHAIRMGRTTIVTQPPISPTTDIQVLGHPSTSDARDDHA